MTRHPRWTVLPLKCMASLGMLCLSATLLAGCAKSDRLFPDLDGLSREQKANALFAKQSCACAADSACCDTYSRYCAKLAATRACVPPEDAAKFAPSAWGSVARWLNAPTDQSAAALFPEFANAIPIVDFVADPDTVPANATYDFDSCSLTADGANLDDLRVYARDLDGFRGWLPEGLLPESDQCSANDDCYLRVNTAHIGREITIRRDGIPCEDPAARALGTCAIHHSSVSGDGITDHAAYRGNVIIADTIRVDGQIDLGQLSLVLLARKEVEFLPGSALLGGHVMEPMPQPGAGRAFVEARPPEDVCVGVTRDGLSPQGEAYEIFGSVARRYYSHFQLGASGPPGGDSGFVAIITPSVTGRGRIDLQGIPGGKGADGADAECRYDDMQCLDSIFYLDGNHEGSFGARGGTGGPGGRVILRTARVVPGTIDVSVAGGAGGPGGDPGSVHVDPFACPGITAHPIYPPGTHAIGDSGAPGQVGPAGAVDQGALQGSWEDYAYLFAGRGAKRHLYAGNFAAHDIENNASVAAATRNYDVIARHYCGIPAMAVIEDTVTLPSDSEGPTALSDTLPVGVAVGLADDLLVSEQTIAERTALCTERKFRMGRVANRVNWFGFPDAFVMYTRPDIMHDFRSQALAQMSGVRDQFWTAVASGSASFDADTLYAHAVRNTVARRKAYETTRLRQSELAKRVARAPLRMQQNQARLAQLNDRFSTLRAQLETKLAPECDLSCVLGAMLDFVTSVVSVIAGGIDLVNGIADTFEVFTEMSLDSAVDRLLNDDRDALEALVNYAETLQKGVKSLDLVGVEEVVEHGKEFKKEYKELEKNFDAFADMVIRPDSEPGLKIVRALARFGANSLETENELLEILHGINQTLAQVEGGSTPLRDRKGGIANLNTMRDIVLLQIGVVRESLNLLEDEFIACSELTIANEEAKLAEIELGNSLAAEHRLGCRTGHVAGEDCSGIIALPSSSVLGDVRDDICRIGKDANETALLFDYLYHRSRDFVRLKDLAAEGDAAARAAHDLRRNFLRPDHWSQVSVPATDILVHEFVDELTPRAEGVHAGGICDPRKSCSFAASGGADRNAIAFGDFVRDGRATVEVVTPVPDLAERKRVTKFDVRLEAPPPYRLGCETLATCPPATPADQPFAHQYSLFFAHDAEAIFKHNSGLRSYYFDKRYPSVACEVAQSFLPEDDPTRRDCEAIVHFEGRQFYFSAIAEDFSPTHGIAASNYTDPDIFGTSVRGQWSIDMRETLVGLGHDDQCYSFSATAPMSALCYPKECTSPCFDNSGARLPAGTGPADCDCYATDGNLDASDPACAGLAASLNYLRTDGAQPEMCEFDINGISLLERTCKAYIDGTSQQLAAQGDARCCASPDRLRDDLSAADAAYCSNAGLDANASCATPSICYEICGPRCKLFKESLRGFRYRIYWRDGE